MVNFDSGDVCAVPRCIVIATGTTVNEHVKMALGPKNACNYRQGMFGVVAHS